VRRYTEAELRPGPTASAVLAVAADDCRLLDLRGLLGNRAAGRGPGL